jgi:hypothetical protein
MAEIALTNLIYYIEECFYTDKLGKYKSYLMPLGVADRWLSELREHFKAKPKVWELSREEDSIFYLDTESHIVIVQVCFSDENYRVRVIQKGYEEARDDWINHVESGAVLL